MPQHVSLIHSISHKRREKKSVETVWHQAARAGSNIAAGKHKVLQTGYWSHKSLQQAPQLTGVGLEPLAWHRLSDEVVLQQTGRFLRHLDGRQRAFLPRVHDLADGVSVWTGWGRRAQRQSQTMSTSKKTFTHQISYTKKYFSNC